MGRADFAVDTVCDFSWSHKIKVSPTQPYMTFEYVTVKRRGEAVRSEAKIAACLENLYTKTFVEQTYSKDRIKYFASMEECLSAVADGRADAVFVPRSEVPYLIEETGTYNLEVMPESVYSERMSLGVSKIADNRLWIILNKEINHISSEWIRNLVNVDEQIHHSFSPRWFVYNYPLEAMIVVVVFMCVIGAAFGYRERMKREHIAVIQHMAYTDERTDLPNLAWLEKEVPNVIERQTDNYRAGMLYVVVFVVESKSAAVVEYGRELLNNQLKRMAHHMEKKDWVLLTATGVDAGNLVTVCIGKDDETIKKLVAEAVNKYSYIKT